MRVISNWLPCWLFWLSLSQHIDFSWSSAVEANPRCSSPLKPSDAGQTEPLPEGGDCTAMLETSETSTVIHDDREGVLLFPWVNLHFQCALNSFTSLHLLHKIPQLPFRTFSSGPSLSKDSFEFVADPTDVYVRIFHSSTSDCAVSGDDVEPHILPCCLECYISI